MLEVLLAWSILMIALLGWLSLQIDNLRKIRHAYFNSIATVQVQSMAERLRANKESHSREREKQIWNLQNKEILPKGEGDFNCQQRTCVIILRWYEWSLQIMTETLVI